MLMFVFGFFIGVYITMVTTMVVLTSVDKANDKKAFVKKLVKKEGWIGARLTLEASFNRSYMKIWAKLYGEYIEGVYGKWN